MIDDPRNTSAAKRAATIDGDGSPATPRDPRSVGDLIRELADEGRTLLRNEVSLVKAELTDKVHVYEKNSSRIAIGSAFLLAALFFVLWAVNMGVTALLTLVVETEIAVWLAPLILGILLAVIGRGMVRGGAEEIRHEGIVPERTAQTLRDDTRWAKDQVNHG